jgi:hypothetical protein
MAWAGYVVRTEIGQMVNEETILVGKPEKWTMWEIQT